MGAMRIWAWTLMGVVGILLATNRAWANDWKIYASYHNATKAVKTDSRIFVLANNDLFSYDEEDNMVELYDKTNALSDFGIADIAYSSESKVLVVLYDNGNIDLLGMNGGVWNMPDIKTKLSSDKTLNELKVVGSEALISLNSGLALINLREGYFVDFYTFSSKVTNATIQNGKIYAKTASGVMEGDRSKNLLDANNWTTVAASTATFGQTETEKKEAEELLAKMENIVPNSPVRNYAYKLNMIGNRLLVAGGNFYYPEAEYTGTAMKYEEGKWTAFDEEEPIKLVGANAYRNVTDVVQDPNDTEHHWLGTKRSGIYEFKNYQLANHYTYDNSPLTSILPESAHPDYFVRVTGLNYDKDGNLWMCNNQGDTIVRILKNDGTWAAYYYDEVANKPTFDHTMFDQRGWAWITCRRTTNEFGASGILVINTNGTINTQSDDSHRYLSTFSNQNGESYTPDLYYCTTEDLDGALWMGCTMGVFKTTTPEKIFDSNFTFTQPIVPRNDGSGLGDYLLSGVPVKCITIDGGNRKWIGTVNNGVYLLSADGMETIEHFTVENSPLISNEINDIAIYGETGEVFIATSKGLCSYQGNATDPATSMQSDNLKVFPNPVRPDYQGDVHITGLMYNSNVKIVSAAGKLVTEGTSVGGEFSWDCRYNNGRHVASGVYYALCTDEDGNKGAVAKILIIK
ncbi:MAG: Por secretion system protein [Bacteroidaceae bacterium]|nr:Por secretion system protein [Bacteroidaceae bacterium]